VRGNIFTKMANNIAIAVKKGGGVADPDFNFSLRLAIEKARAVSMPMENIKRAIERGLGKGDGGQLTEVLIEGFGPGGFGVLVEGISDNTNRTIGDVRLVIEKNGGAMGVPGSVAYQFEHVAAIEYDGKLSEEMQLSLIDLGMNDFEEEDGRGVVYASFDKSKLISDTLEANLIKVSDVNLVYLPKITSQIDAEKVEEFVDKIRELDDVQEIFTNVV